MRYIEITSQEIDEQVRILRNKIDELNEIKNKATRRKCFHKCARCEKRSHLSKWSKMNSYHFQDDVYTQNMVLSDSLVLICPNCGRRSWAKKVLGKYDHLEFKKPQLDLYAKMKTFENAGGTFAKYYTDYNGNYDKNYYEVEPYSGMNGVNQKYKNPLNIRPFVN